MSEIGVAHVPGDSRYPFDSRRIQDVGKIVDDASRRRDCQPGLGLSGGCDGKHRNRKNGERSGLRDYLASTLDFKAVSGTYLPDHDKQSQFCAQRESCDSWSRRLQPFRLCSASE